jgi:hypothetical protein
MGFKPLEHIKTGISEVIRTYNFNQYSKNGGTK